MDTGEISDAQLGFFIALPVSFFLLIVVSVSCCYWKKLFCFDTKRDDVLLPAANTQRYTVNLSKRSRRNSAFFSETGSLDRASLDDDVMSGDLKVGTYIQSPFAYPDITHSVPIGQTTRRSKKQRKSSSSLQVPNQNSHKSRSLPKHLKSFSKYEKIDSLDDGLRPGDLRLSIPNNHTSTDGKTNSLPKEVLTTSPVTPSVSIHFDCKTSSASEKDSDRQISYRNSSPQIYLSPHRISDSKSVDMFTTSTNNQRRTSFDLQMLKSGLQRQGDLCNGSDKKRHSIADTEIKDALTSSTPGNASNAPSTPLSLFHASKESLTSNPVASERRRSSMQIPIDLKQIDPRMYQLQTAQWPSIDAEPHDDRESSQINFNIEYNREHETFTVKLIQAIDLPPQDGSETCNPYCTVTLEPDFSPRKTKVYRQTCNPEFEETFIFSVNPTRLKEQTLVIKSFCFDRFSRDECSTMLKLKLRDIDFEMNPSIDLDRKLSQVKEETLSKNYDSRGDLLVAISYLQTAEKLTVSIQKARNLQLIESKKSSLPDIYTKVCFYKGHQRLKKKKTSTVPASNNPVFNQALTFNISYDALRAPDTRLLFCVVHDFKLANNVDIGHLELGKFCSDFEAKDHWTEMISQGGNKALARWHCLSPPPVHENNSPEHESLPSYARRKSLAILESFKPSSHSGDRDRQSFS